MPYINVKVAGKLTMEQKRTIADEVSIDNWAKGANILGNVDRVSEKK